MQKKEEYIRLRFSGEDEIDLETLTTSLRSTLTSLELISKNVLGEDEYCKYVVRNVEKGSFIVDIQTITEIANSFVPFTPFIGEVFTGILSLRKFLKGSKPKQVVNNYEYNNCTVVNIDDSELVLPIETVNIYSKEENIEKALAKTAKVLANDEGRTEFSVEVNDGQDTTEIGFSKDELKIVSETIDVDDFNDGIEIYNSTEVLNVVSIDFKGTKQWTFFRIGTGVISAHILDKEFLKRIVEDHISFSDSTKLKVELEIRYKKNNGKSIKRNTKYLINKVLEIYHREENISIDDVQE